MFCFNRSSDKTQAVSESIQPVENFSSDRLCPEMTFSSIDQNSESQKLQESSIDPLKNDQKEKTAEKMIEKAEETPRSLGRLSCDCKCC